jgi:hypothetical protein
MPDARRSATPTDPALLAQQAAITAEDAERAKLAAERDGSKLLNAMLNAVREK